MSAASSHLPSLRKEVGKALALVSLVWLAMLFVAVGLGVRHEVDNLMDDALQEAAEVIYGLLVLCGPNLPLVAGASMPAPEHDERLVWQIVDDHQAVVMRSHQAPLLALLPHFRAGFSDSPDSWRVYAMRLPNGTQVLYVAQEINERFESRYEAIVGVGAGGVLVSLLCALWLREQVSRALLPLQQLSDQIAVFDPMRTDTPLPAATRQEFVAIRRAIVDLGHRLVQRVEREQAFSAHAAHALRSPLAGMDAQLAVAMQESPASARPRLQRAREAVATLKRVVTSLLALFRSDAALQLGEVDLAQMVAHANVAGLQVNITQDGPLRADPNLLAAALANLLDNALRYGARRCWLEGHAVAGGCNLTVRDDGPGMSVARYREIQDCLEPPGQAPAFGLGLRLAALVARAHHGQLVIAPPVAGSGFSVTMELRGELPTASNGQAPK